MATLWKQSTSLKKIDEAISLKEYEDPAIRDSRHPLYLGSWERSIPYLHDDIANDDMDEPHIKRKHTILKAHPEIKQLYGIDTRTKWVALASVTTHVATAHLFGKILVDWHWTMVVTAYILGGSLTGLYGVLIHECSHALAFQKLLHNRILGLIVNIGIPFPIAQSFRRYHLEHHSFQGVTDRDPDLPLAWEYKLIKGNPLLKFLWVFCYPVLYVVRGAAMMKKPQKWELINWVWTIMTDSLIWYFCGARGFLYIFLSLWFGYGCHPAAAHFIQEHYTFIDGQETYSYYGFLNTPFMNIGYHNEHHDFTKIPWSKLPDIRAIAPEFYNNLGYHTSWVKVIIDFILNSDIGPQSRVGRTIEEHYNGRTFVKDIRGETKKMA